MRIINGTLPELSRLAGLGVKLKESQAKTKVV